MKAKVLKEFWEGEEHFTKNEEVTVWTKGKAPKAKHLNLRRFNSLKNRGLVKGAKA